MLNATKKIALIIDAENIRPGAIEAVLREIQHFGLCNVRRAYGDWSTPNLRGWKEVLHQYAIQPIQQFTYTTGKNNSDSAMIIDAMDLLHDEKMKLDGFAIASSDSDFTRLAVRIREEGLLTLGFGQRHTPVAFTAACDRFFFTETPPSSEQEAKVVPNHPLASHSQLEQLIVEVLESALEKHGKGGWVSLSDFGSQLYVRHPHFNLRAYGQKNLTKFLTGNCMSYLEMQSCPEGTVQMYVRRKRGAVVLLKPQPQPQPEFELDESRDPDVFRRLGHLFATPQQ